MLNVRSPKSSIHIKEFCLLINRFCTENLLMLNVRSHKQIFVQKIFKKIQTKIVCFSFGYIFYLYKEGIPLTCRLKIFDVKYTLYTAQHKSYKLCSVLKSLLFSFSLQINFALSLSSFQHLALFMDSLFLFEEETTEGVKMNFIFASLHQSCIYATHYDPTSKRLYFTIEKVVYKA